MVDFVLECFLEVDKDFFSFRNTMNLCQQSSEIRNQFGVNDLVQNVYFLNSGYRYFNRFYNYRFFTFQT